MHANIAFGKPGKAHNIAFARQRGFGTLVVNATAVPLISHVPFLLGEDGRILEFHLNRSNPILKMPADETEAVMIVAGGIVFQVLPLNAFRGRGGNAVLQFS